MVVSYRNKFLKVFFSSLLLFALILIFVVPLYRYTASDFSGSIPGYTLFISKYLLFPVVLVAYGLYAWSHYLLAKAKGYSGWLALLSLLNFFIGLAILFLLPDKRKSG